MSCNFGSKHHFGLKFVQSKHKSGGEESLLDICFSQNQRGFLRRRLRGQLQSSSIGKLSRRRLPQYTGPEFKILSLTVVLSTVLQPRVLSTVRRQAPIRPSKHSDTGNIAPPRIAESTECEPSSEAFKRVALDAIAYSSMLHCLKSFHPAHQPPRNLLRSLLIPLVLFRRVTSSKRNSLSVSKPTRPPQKFAPKRSFLRMCRRIGPWMSLRTPASKIDDFAGPGCDISVPIRTCSLTVNASAGRARSRDVASRVASAAGTLSVAHQDNRVRSLGACPPHPVRSPDAGVDVTANSRLAPRRRLAALPSISAPTPAHSHLTPFASHQPIVVHSSAL
ncbi:hypothetical protein K438DRAFT_1786795 [Mycena galopus ATCC 62051]|nr:hypothetical protein K438DRAFT_1786795 [Mycena galopus ATCC 62051]